MLVDSGYPLKKDIVAGGYEDIYPIRANCPESIEEVLAPFGARPEDITHIFLTHLHYDHSWNLKYFPNAKLYAQKREMEAALHPLPRYSERIKAYGLDPRTVGETWIACLDRFIPVDGDADLIPGIRCILTRGHSMGSQTIIVDTREGTYAFPGDYAASVDSVYNCDPVGMVISLVDWYEDYPKVKALVDAGVKFLANHDPRTFEHKVYG